MGAQTYYREAVEPAVATMFQSTSRPEQAIFHKEGEYWTIGCGGNEFRLKDTKGLGYIAHLLRHPRPNSTCSILQAESQANATRAR